MIKNIRHTGIVVADLEESLRFYRQLLGFEVVKQMDESGEYMETALSLENVRITTVKLDSKCGQTIELVKYHSHHSEKRQSNVFDPGISHLAFTVADLTGCFETLSKEAVVFNSPPQTSPDGFARVAFCRAPEGTLIELVELL